MPNIDKLLKQSDAGFKRYTGIHKATFYDMLDAMQEYEASKTKSGRPSGAFPKNCVTAYNPITGE